MPRPSHVLIGIACVAIIVFALFTISLLPVGRKTSAPSSFVPLTEPTITFVDQKFGATQPKQTIVEFIDYQCEPCREADKNMRALLAENPDVQWIIKQYPNESAHPFATPAAIAALCAARQQKFWEYHTALLERQTALSTATFVEIASSLGLNTKTFQSCVEKQDTLAVVKKNFEEGQALSVSATPTFFIKDQRLVGLTSIEELRAALRQAINR